MKRGPKYVDPVNKDGGGQVQGEGAQVVWDDLMPGAVYANPLLVEAYQKQSETLATVTHALASRGGSLGLNGLAVADFGCGHGTTSVELMRYKPAKIVAFDTSPAQVKLLEAQVAGPGSLMEYMTPIREATDSSFPFIPFYEYRHGAITNFKNKKGVFTTMQGSLQNAKENGPFHVIVANQAAHWEIIEAKKRIAKETQEDEHLVNQRGIGEFLCRDVYHSLLARGIFAMGVSSDYVVLADPAADNEMLGCGLTSHPVYWWLNEEINKLLNELGIVRDMPPSGDTRNKIFFEEQLRTTYGLHAEYMNLICFAQYEFRYNQDPVEAFELRAPMWLGKFNPQEEPYKELTFQKRFQLIKKAASTVREKYKGKAGLSQPLVERWFTIAFQKV